MNETAIEHHYQTFITQIQQNKRLPDSTRKTITQMLKHDMRPSYVDISRTEIATHISQPEFDSAQIEDALRWCKKLKGDDYTMGRLLNIKGLALMERNNLREASNAFKQSLNLLNRTQAQLEIPTVYLNLGNTYYRNKQLLLAASSYQKAIYYEDSIDIEPIKAANYIGLAQVYTDLRKYSSAHTLLNQTIKYLPKASNYEKYYFHMTAGTCYYYEGKHQQAYAQLLLALEYANQVSPFEQIMCLLGLSETALIANTPQQALTHINDCIALRKEHPEYDNNAELNYYLGSLYGDILTANGQLLEAHKVFNNLPNENKVQLKYHKALHYGRISNFAEREKDYHKAFLYIKKAQLYEDSIKNEYTSNCITELGQRYQHDTTLLRKHYAQAGNEAKSSRYHLRLTTFVGSICLFFLGFIIAVIILRRRNEKRFQEQMEKAARLRMDIIRNRLSPHFLFNVLGLMLPKFRSNPELHQISSLFIDVLRGNLMVSDETSVELSKEIALIKQYIALYHKITGENPKVIWHDATNGEADQIKIPTMCIQIPIENALKHAFPTPNENSEINVYLMTEKDRLIVKIIDNGNGYDPGKVEPTGRDTGTGLRVLHRTIALLNQKNARPIEFHIKNLCNDGAKGTEVIISIPYKFSYNINPNL